jgi:hypothetical protein
MVKVNVVAEEVDTPDRKKKKKPKKRKIRIYLI